jgi:hypothetical protein
MENSCDNTDRKKIKLLGEKNLSQYKFFHLERHMDWSWCHISYINIQHHHRENFKPSKNVISLSL